jgi:hypothetical protein
VRCLTAQTRSWSAADSIRGELCGRHERSSKHAPEALASGLARRARTTHRLTVAGDTQKRAAARFCVMPPSTASTIRRRPPGPSLTLR